jgi:hypothetical protein
LGTVQYWGGAGNALTQGVAFKDLELGMRIQFMSTKTKQWTDGLVYGLDTNPLNQDRALVQRPNGTRAWMKLETLRLIPAPKTPALPPKGQ